MNQRFQNAEINSVRNSFAHNPLYQAIEALGAEFEAELQSFGMCAEECFVETLEVISLIADKGDGVEAELEKLWLTKYNEYRRIDRSVAPDEIRKIVGIVMGYAILSVGSSRHRYYRYSLTKKITELIAKHKFDGWDNTLLRIVARPMPDGWFDEFVLADPGSDSALLSQMSQQIGAIQQMLPPGSPLILQLVGIQHNSNCQQFMGEMNNPQFIAPKASE